MNAYLLASLRAVGLAAEAVTDVYDRAFGVGYKDDGSPLTEADSRSHEVLAAELGRDFPEVPLLSEEAALVPYESRRSWPLYWLVDPLDGTKEFIKRNGEFTVNIALIRAGTPVLGVVCAPALGLLYAGAEGCGAFKLCFGPGGAPFAPEELFSKGTRLPLPAAPRPFTVVASRSHSSPETEEFIRGLRKEHPGLALTNSGSSLKLCLVAEGSADVYPRFAPTMEWDTAAGDAVARAAGCRVFAAVPGGGERPLAYNKADLHNPWFIVRR